MPTLRRGIRFLGLLAVGSSSFFEKASALCTCPLSLQPRPQRSLAALHQRVAAPGNKAYITSTSTVALSSSSLSLADEIRDEFPILAQPAQNGKPLVYLDSAATSQKPRVVLNALNDYYLEANANVHRGAHFLANRATERYEAARSKVQRFVNAARREEIIFTRGASEAINLVANTWGAAELGPGDEIILSVMEHHSNLVPWQLLAERNGVLLNFVRLDEAQQFDLSHFKEILEGSEGRTKLVALPHVSNVLGCVNPVEEVVTLSHAAGAKVMVDACQSVPHMPVDVQALGCDWLVASGHKMCAPTGIGFLYGRYEALCSMPPWQGGGEMIDQVFLTHSTYAPPPGRFEAGTPAIAQAVGLGAACDFLQGIGMDRVQRHEDALAAKLWDALDGIPGLTRFGPAPSPNSSRAALVAFHSHDVHAQDLTFFLDQDGVAVRSGHHCTQPLHRELGVASSARASLYIYNSEADIDIFVDKLKGTLNMFDHMGQ